MTANRSHGVVLLGLDLAWVSHNPSGAVVLNSHESGYCTSEPRTLGDDATVLAWVAHESAAAGLAVLAIDAPLFAPNPPGTARPADSATSRLYGRYHASTYPANREKCARPIALTDGLEQRGWNPCPFALREELALALRMGRPPQGRFVIEVYPHAACVGLFGLPRIISYKRGRLAQRRAGLGSLQELLHARLPAPVGKDMPQIEPFERSDIATLRGRALKAHEDRLDGLLCAAMAAAFVHSPDRCIIAGADGPTEARLGYIVVPRPRQSA